MLYGVPDVINRKPSPAPHLHAVAPVRIETIANGSDQVNLWHLWRLTG